MNKEAILKQLGYIPNEALLSQFDRIVNNTKSFDKIQKHILDLNEHLKVDDSHVTMSNSEDYFKIKIEAPSPERTEEAMEKVHHFADKYKVALKQVAGKNTFYILGFEK
jgi:acetolactate synthase small subunit